MSIVRKLKALLGRDDASAEPERDVTVTVEHDPENEAAVKGAEVEESPGAGDGDAAETAAAETDEGAATADAVDEVDAGAVDESATAEEPTEETDESPDEVEIDDAEAAAESDAADDGGASESVDVLNGIGPAYADRLADAGIDTVADLADADAAELSEATDVAEGRIQGWIDQAAEY